MIIKTFIFFFLSFLTIFNFVFSNENLECENEDKISCVCGPYIISSTFLGKSYEIWQEEYYPDGDFLLKDRYLYFSVDGKFYKVDISNLASPQIIYSLKENIKKFYLKGKYLYTNGKNFRKIDISNPSSPKTFIPLYDIPVKDFLIKDNYAYIVNDKKFQILDITDFLYPIEISSLNVKGYRLFMKDNYVFVFNENKLLSIDVSDINFPKKVGSFKTFATKEIYPTKYCVYATAFPLSYPYLPRRAVFKIIDISVPEYPGTVFASDFGLKLRGGKDIDFVENYVYIADERYGLKIIDVSNPFTPQIKKTIYTGKRIEKIGVFGDFAFLIEKSLPKTSSLNEKIDLFLTIMKVSNLEAFPILKSIDKKDVYDISTVEDKSFLAVFNKQRILEIFDISNPVSLKKLKEVNFSSEKIFSFEGNPNIIGKIFKREKEFRILDISNPQNPKVLSRLRANTAFLKEKYVFIGDLNIFRIVDISNLYHPKLVSELRLKTKIVDIFIQNKYAYILGLDGLYIVDISDIYIPKLISFLPIKNPSYIYIYQDYAYIITFDRYKTKGKIKIVDISNPSSPEVVNNYQTNFKNIKEDFVIYDNYLLIPQGKKGIEIIDISNPENPKTEGFIKTYEALGIALKKPYIYVLDSYDGIVIINIQRFLKCNNFIKENLPSNYPFSLKEKKKDFENSFPLFIGDKDNDGIPDEKEGCVDTDKDGLSDMEDIDSDGDKVFDFIEDIETVKEKNKIKIVFTEKVLSYLKDKIHIPQNLLNKEIEIVVEDENAVLKPLGDFPIPIISEEEIGNIPEYEFPFGLLAIKIENISPGQMLKVRINLPSPIPENAVYLQISSREPPRKIHHLIQSSKDGKNWQKSIVPGSKYIKLTLIDGEKIDEDRKRNRKIINISGIGLPINSFEDKEKNNKDIPPSINNGGGGCSLKKDTDYSLILVFSLLAFLFYLKSRKIFIERKV
ncbi:MAG: hypothetical protein GXO21_00895 [Aquificae bacterium]|nr:hypothetical protein [Aquificota bacterium]